MFEVKTRFDHQLTTHETELEWSSSSLQGSKSPSGQASRQISPERGWWFSLGSSFHCPWLATNSAVPWIWKGRIWSLRNSAAYHSLTLCPCLRMNQKYLVAGSAQDFSLPICSDAMAKRSSMSYIDMSGPPPKGVEGISYIRGTTNDHVQLNQKIPRNILKQFSAGQV